MYGKELTFEEYMQREIPLHSRRYAQEYPITALINLVTPLIKKHPESLKLLQEKVISVESKVNKKINVIERWLRSDRMFIKVTVENKWGKSIVKKVYKSEVQGQINDLMNWIYSEIVYKLLYTDFNTEQMGGE